ncbi:MAG: hypothetical protein ACKOPQ_01715, partial [Novosphingobium sp.]
ARGTASVVDYGTSGGVIGWSRWAGGTVINRSSNNLESEIPANGGLSTIWGTPATNLPTSGTATYAMVGSTKPIMQSGAVAPGTVNSAALAVNFGTQRVGLDASVTINGTTYNFGSTGGTAAPSMVLGTNATFQETNSTVHLFGFLAGPGASHAGVSYNGFAQGISGVIAFAKPSQNPFLGSPGLTIIPQEQVRR